MLRPLLFLGLAAAPALAQEREPGPILEGTITDANGSPVEGVRVVLFGGLATRWQVAAASSDERGVYRFDPCIHGARMKNEPEDRRDYYVGMQLEHPELVSSDGSWWWDVTVADVDGQVTRKDFAMTAGGRLTGTLVDELNKPYALALRLQGSGDNPYFRLSEADEQGRIEERGLFPGAYAVDVNDGDLDYPVIGTFEIRAGETTRVELSFERVREGEQPRRVESRYLLREGTGVGRATLNRTNGVLSIDARIEGERREERIDLAQLVDPSFRPLCFESTSATTLTIAGVLGRKPWETVIGELSWLRDPSEPERWQEIYRGTGIVRPIAVDVLPGEPADVLVLDGGGPALFVWERARHTLHTLALPQTAPGLGKARFLSVEALEGGAGKPGYVIRTCSVDPQGENIPLITKPAYLYLRDDDGDFVIDDVSPHGR